MPPKRYDGRMLILVDGYNVTMRDDSLARLSKQQQRDALIATLASSGRGRLGAGEIVVVFDAHASLGVTSERVGSIKVVYAIDADSEIVRRAECAVGQVVVVTDDMRLRARLSQDVTRRIDYRAASVCTTDRRQRVRGAEAAHEDRPVDARKITEELADLWLPEDDGSSSKD